MYWLISDKLKMVFEGVDPEAFAFMECETTYPDSEVAPRYWMCDVVRVLNAVDEKNSNVKVSTDAGVKVYELDIGTRLVFMEDIILGARVFRLTYRYSAVCCDAGLRDACIAAEIKGVTFTNVDGV